MADFLEELDTNVFGISRSNEPSYQYYGHFDNVRYFQAGCRDINYIGMTPYFLEYDRETQFDENGYITENANYQYSYEYIGPAVAYSEIMEATETITAYYPKANE
jgi:hypothetical protein